MHFILLGVSGLIMIVLPLLIASSFARRFGVEWGLFGAGAVTFVASQLLHIPFNRFVETRFMPEFDPAVEVGLFVAVALLYGLSAGVFEEVGRYVTFRFWRRDARSWSEGLMVGAGHGGIESLILGLIVVVNAAVLYGIAQGAFGGLVPDDALAGVQAEVATLMEAPLYEMMLGAVERALTIVVHLSLSLMVLRAVARGSLRWLLLAVSWHTLLNATALVVAQYSSAVWAEVGIAVFALVSLGLIYRWRPPSPGDQEPEPALLPEKRPLPKVELEDMEAKLEDSRYS